MKGTIQWYPGHIAKVERELKDRLAHVDVILNVLDARLPQTTFNQRVVAQLSPNKPMVLLLNKADLADPAVTQAWLDFYNRQPNVKAVAISCKKPGDAARVPALCKALAPHRNDTFKPLRMLIMGIPNVGKSTLMNALLKRRVAAVGDEPAVTKMQMSADLNPTMTLTDTPGLMWPKIAHDSDGFMLAASHAIGRNAVIDSEVGIFLAGLLLQRYPALLAARYKIEVDGLDGVAAVEAIAKKRGCITKGRHAGELDLEKAAMILLTDYRGGKLGRISLETPESRAAMLATEKSKSGD